MSVNFPTNRPEAGLGSGSLQQGDSWRFGSIEYTWVITPDGTGIWSSKGINVNPDLYIAKVDDFSGDVSGTYNSGLDVIKASEAEVADKVASTLTLTFQPAVGDPTTITYDGSSAQAITFADTDIAQDVITINGSEGIDVTDGTNISTNSTVARIRTSSPETVNNSNYLYRKNGTSIETVRAYRADRAQYDENGEDLINQTELTTAINAIDVNGSGRIHCDIRNFRSDSDTSWDNAFQSAINATGSVYLPAGAYNFVSSVGSSVSSANVYGDGSGQTILNFAAGSGLSFTGLRQGADWDTVTIKGITVNGSSGTGINIQYAASGNSAQKVFCEDVTVVNYTTGWNIIDTDNSTYNACSALTCGTGLNVISGPGDAVNIRFNNWQIADCTTGVNISTSAEGVYVTDSVIINCTTGVYFKGNTGGAQAAEPFFVLRGNNIDCITTSVVMEACIQASITDNSFYKRNNTAGDWIGLRILGNSYDNVFSNNIFNGMTRRSGPSKTGVSIERLAHSTFSDNHFLELNAAFNIAWIPETNNITFVENDYRELDVTIPTPTNGKTLNVNLIEKGHLVKEKGLDNRLHILNGDGVFVYDASNSDGFQLNPVSIREEVVYAEDFFDSTTRASKNDRTVTYAIWNSMKNKADDIGADPDGTGVVWGPYNYIWDMTAAQFRSAFREPQKWVGASKNQTTHKLKSGAGDAFHFQGQGTKISNLTFQHNSTQTILVKVERNPNDNESNSSGNGGQQSDEADMDSNFVNVGFTNISDDTDVGLYYQGRNAIIKDCSFTGTKGTGVRLTFPNTPGSTLGTNGGNNQSIASPAQGGAHGWRRCQLVNNVFHKIDTCFHVIGKYQLIGAVFANNISDTGATLIHVQNAEGNIGSQWNSDGGGLQDCIIVGNSCCGDGDQGPPTAGANTSSIIFFDANTNIIRTTITGNTFYGYDGKMRDVYNGGADLVNSDLKRPYHHICAADGSFVDNLTISGNNFSFCEDYSINLNGKSGKNNVVCITGNSFIGIGVRRRRNESDQTPKTAIRFRDSRMAGSFVGNTYNTDPVIQSNSSVAFLTTGKKDQIKGEGTNYNSTGGAEIN